MTTELSGRQIRTIVLFVLASLFGISFAVWQAAGMSGARQTPGPGEPTLAADAKPTRTPRPTRTLKPTQTSQVQPTPIPSASRPAKIGIVAGHWQNDPGAVCPDGLQEVDINLDIASRVVASLQLRGYEAELLPEFSDELQGFQADAFVSIHADSCEGPRLSGFKVARLAASAIPEQEDRLVACLVQEYSRVTGLQFHRNTVTFDMTDYHAFKEIDAQTPGAIIELGFMSGDRDLLTKHSATLAEGVTLGILCFLEGE